MKIRIFTRRILLLTVCLILAVVIVSAESVPVQIEGSIFGGSAGESVYLTATFSDEWLTSPDADIYRPDLAQFASVLSADVYFREKDVGTPKLNRVLFEGEDPERYDRTALIRRFGFTDTEYIETAKTEAPGTDANDSVTVLMGRKTSDDLYDIYVFAFRGAYSIQEWCSAFDTGADTDLYTTVTGNHPEWKDRRCFKSIDVAANRAIILLDSFMEKNGSPDRKKCILVTGHSRGGMIANRIGAILEKREDCISRTYTFNSPGFTLDPDIGEYRTIFNLGDQNDFFTDPLPFANETFLRYGRNLFLPIRDSEELIHGIDALKGKDDFVSLTAKQQETYRGMFGKLFPDRADLYEPRMLNISFDSMEEAEKALVNRKRCLGSDEGLGLETFCRIYGRGKEGTIAADEDGRYTVTLEYSGAALLTAYAKELAYGQACRPIFDDLFAGDEQAIALSDFYMENLSEINGSHRLINSYVLSESFR